MAWGSVEFCKNRCCGSVLTERYKLNFAPCFLYLLSDFGKTIGIVEAYSLNGINKTVPPVFCVFNPILEKRNRYSGSVLTEWHKWNFAPCFLYLLSDFGKTIGIVEACSLNGINETVPPVFCVFNPILEKRNRYSGSVLTEWYKWNFAPCFLYLLSDFGKTIGIVEAYSLNGINETMPPVSCVFNPILQRRNQHSGSILTERYKWNYALCFLCF